MRKILSVAVLSLVCYSCNPGSGDKNNMQPVRIITLEPGHFHAALVQKSMYAGVDSVVHVYAPEGQDLKWHLGRIDSYNNRKEDPTHWKEVVYPGNDYFDKMIAEKAGNVVVISGNNSRKTENIYRSVETGFNVLADKPMVINTEGFKKLKEAFDVAAKNKVLLYDIMTERYEITTILQRELSTFPDVFGELEKGTPENPAITKVSVHHFYKYVSGSVLVRPAWFMDVAQQGEGIVDVMTHLVDLVQWACFPEQSIDYMNDIKIDEAKRWNTPMSLSQFKTITGLQGFPDYLKSNVSQDSILNVSCNGEINYQLKGVHAKTSVVWAYQAPEGAGDSHQSSMRGTKASLSIRQTAHEQFKSTLFIEPVANDAGYEQSLKSALTKIQEKYPGVDVKKTEMGFEVIIPDKYKEGHEAHFGRVMQNFLDYFNGKPMPSWEVPNMIAKYFTTTSALDMAKGSTSK